MSCSIRGRRCNRILDNYQYFSSSIGPTATTWNCCAAPIPFVRFAWPFDPAVARRVGCTALKSCSGMRRACLVAHKRTLAADSRVFGLACGWT
jgi:hypothetical protein